MNCPDILRCTTSALPVSKRKMRFLPGARSRRIALASPRLNSAAFLGKQCEYCPSPKQAWVFERSPFVSADRRLSFEGRGVGFRLQAFRHTHRVQGLAYRV